MLITENIYSITCFYIIICSCGTHSSNILLISPIPSVSHSVATIEFAKALVKRGHNVDVVSHFPLNEPINGYNDISIKGSENILTDSFVFDYVKCLQGTAVVKYTIKNVGINTCKSALESLQLQRLKNSTKKYDLFITEMFASDCMLGWAWYFNVPTILVTTSIPLPWTTDRFGLPDNPAYIPTYYVEYYSEMTLYERIINTWSLLHSKVIYEFNSRRPSEQIAREFFGEAMPSLQDLAYNSSLMLINTHFSINDARPLVPNVIEVGGLHIGGSKSLNQYFDGVLETELEGIILFTMGSLVSIESFPEDTLQEIFDAISYLPYTVLMKARKEKISKNLKIPGNIHFEAWMPQLDILCDSRVKLFISHGGMMGTQEAVYCGVPILGIPLHSDQKSNVKYAETLGYGLMVTDLTKNNLLEAAKKLLYDSKYIKNAKRVSEEFKDRPMTPQDTAVYWTEYVIRHKGAPRLQSSSKRLFWYQYYLLDIITVVIGASCMIAYLLIVLLKLIFFTKKSENKAKLS